MKTIPLTVPNVLSLYRLASAPFIAILIVLGHDHVFAALFVINMLTDILDGFIARRFNQQSPEGVVIDSYADVGSHLLALLAILKFHSYLFTDKGYWLASFFVMYGLQLVVCKLKHGVWVAGLHLYISKLTGYLQASFLVLLFTYGFIDWLFYTMLVIGVLAEIEVIAVNLLSARPIHDAKGLYWLIREKRLRNDAD